MAPIENGNGSGHSSGERILSMPAFAESVGHFSQTVIEGVSSIADISMSLIKRHNEHIREVSLGIGPVATYGALVKEKIELQPQDTLF